MMHEAAPPGAEEQKGPSQGAPGFYMDVLDVMSDSIKIVSLDRRILFVNQAAAHFLSRSKESLLGTKCHQEFNGYPQPCDFCRIDEVFRTGRLKRFSAWIEKADGTERFMEFSIYPMKSEDELVRWVVEITRDLTESRRIADQIAFQEKLGMLGEIAARVAGEMRNPISAILTASRVFTDSADTLSAHEREDLGRILREEGLRVQALLQDFLSVGGRPSPLRVFLDPAGVLEEVAVALRQSGLCPESLQWKVGPLLKGLRIFADAEQVKQALWNIVLNAVEAVDGKGEISLRMEQENETVVWVVGDTGKGIAKGDLAHIFEPFWSSKRGNRGLGLTIAKSFIEMHGGGIDVQCHDAKDTRVFVRLPLGK
jgi:PAS domain S-box-containing protein